MADSPRGLPVKQVIRLKNIRKAMAQAMKSSVANAALSQVSREIDLTPLQTLRRQKLAQAQPRISFPNIPLVVLRPIAQGHDLEKLLILGLAPHPF